MKNSITARKEAKVIPLYNYTVENFSEVNTQMQHIRREFDSFFEMFNRLKKTVEKAYINLEEQEFYSKEVFNNLKSALDTLEDIMPLNNKKSKDYFRYAIEKMPDELVVKVFNTFCEESKSST